MKEVMLRLKIKIMISDDYLDLLTYTFPEDPPTLAGKSGSVSGGDIARFPWVLVH